MVQEATFIDLSQEARSELCVLFPTASTPSTSTRIPLGLSTGLTPARRSKSVSQAARASANNSAMDATANLRYRSAKRELDWANEANSSRAAVPNTFTDVTSLPDP